VPKKLLLENGAPTGADQRLISGGIEELQWIAALKPSTIGIPPHRDAGREYVEIAVLRLVLRPGATAERLIELVHRAVPYPILLVLDHGDRYGLSAAHVRWSQGEVGKTVLDGDVDGVILVPSSDARHIEPFRKALPLVNQPRATLHALYQGWLDTLNALKAARWTGTFSLARDERAAADRRTALQEVARLETEVDHLRAAAIKERQVARQVELNLKIKTLEAERDGLRARL